jgi:hypothetical protein
MRIFAVTNHHTGLKELGTIEMEATARSVQFVPGLNGGVATSKHALANATAEEALKADLVWVGNDKR